MATKILTTALWLSCALLGSSSPTTPQATKVTTIHKFPNGTWLENLAVRSNGGVLLNSLYSPNIFYVDPASASKQPSTLYTFPNPKNALTGIVELGADQFYVAVSIFNPADVTESFGTGQIYKIDVRNYPARKAVATLVANVTNSGLLNGLTAVPATKKILAADSVYGLIWRIDASTGAVDLASSDAALSSPATPCGDTQLGVNGIHAVAKRNVLYFSNTGSCSYGRLPIDSDGLVTGNATILFTNNNVGIDDFIPVLDTPDAAYLTDTAKYNGIVYVDGKSNKFGRIGKVEGPTAVVFGRGADSKNLFVSSTGGDAEYAQQPVPVGGALTKISL